MELSVYGHSGFVGSAFVSECRDDDLYLVPRYSRRPDPSKKTDMVYFISTTHNYHVFTDPTEDVRTNLLVLTETLDSWKRNNPEGVFNFISSWFVYGPRYDEWEQAGLVHEDDTCNPQGFYSITKRCAEQLIESFCQTHSMKYRILRLCNIIGPGDKGVSKQKNALQYLINEMKQNRPIEIYGDGNFTRTYMDKRDCARAIRLVVEKGNLNEIYNIGVEPSQRFIDLIRLAHELIGSQSEIRFIEPKKFHKQVQVENFDMGCSKLHALGFEPKYSIIGTIARLCK